MPATTSTPLGRVTEPDPINAAIDRLVASAPPLSLRQRERLAGVLGGGAREHRQHDLAA